MRKLLEAIEGASFILFCLLTPFFLFRRATWGATAEAVAREAPGDELVLNPVWGYTHAVTVRAEPAEVWPWIVQIGQGRGGFYTYELLENLSGCDIHNVEHVMDDLQDLKVGDGIKLHPNSPPLPVTVVEPGRMLLLHSQMDPMTGGQLDPDSGDPEKAIVTTWLSLIEPGADGATRLITRGLYAYEPSLINNIFMGRFFLEPISFVMERKMLLTIKRLAESNREGTETKEKIQKSEEIEC